VAFPLSELAGQELGAPEAEGPVGSGVLDNRDDKVMRTDDAPLLEQLRQPRVQSCLLCVSATLSASRPVT
jgi:hypothetical protein